MSNSGPGLPDDAQILVPMPLDDLLFIADVLRLDDPGQRKALDMIDARIPAAILDRYRPKGE